MLLLHLHRYLCLLQASNVDQKSMAFPESSKSSEQIMTAEASSLRDRAPVASQLLSREDSLAGLPRSRITYTYVTNSLLIHSVSPALLENPD